MNYLLDTNACIALMNGTPTRVRRRFEMAVDARTDIFVSTIVAFELWYGVAKSARPEANSRRVEIFFAGPLSLLPFDEEDSRIAGRLRGVLEVAGKPIGAYDVLIAGQALHHGAILVTANTREFRRVKDLVWEDWAN